MAFETRQRRDKTFILAMTEEERDTLHEVAGERDVSAAEFVRRAIRQRLNDIEEEDEV